MKPICSGRSVRPVAGRRRVLIRRGRRPGPCRWSQRAARCGPPALARRARRRRGLHRLRVARLGLRSFVAGGIVLVVAWLGGRRGWIVFFVAWLGRRLGFVVGWRWAAVECGWGVRGRAGRGWATVRAGCLRSGAARSQGAGRRRGRGDRDRRAAGLAGPATGRPGCAAGVRPRRRPVDGSGRPPGSPSSAASELVVAVGGKVRKPGLVQLPPGARVADALTRGRRRQPGRRRRAAQPRPQGGRRRAHHGRRHPAAGRRRRPAPAVPGVAAPGRRAGQPQHRHARRPGHACPASARCWPSASSTPATAQGGFKAVSDLRKVDGIGDCPVRAAQGPGDGVRRRTCGWPASRWRPGWPPWPRCFCRPARACSALPGVRLSRRPAVRSLDGSARRSPAPRAGSSVAGRSLGCRPVRLRGRRSARRSAAGVGSRFVGDLGGRLAVRWIVVAVLLGAGCGAVATAARVSVREAGPLARPGRGRATGTRRGCGAR